MLLPLVLFFLSKNYYMHILEKSKIEKIKVAKKKNSKYYEFDMLLVINIFCN